VSTTDGIERPAPAARADAARNRRSVLGAARSLFAERGLDVGMDEIAERAGVGVGTVYRHYPSKAQLADAVFEEVLDEVAALAADALADADAWHGFESFLLRVSARTAVNRGLRGALRTRARESEQLSASWERATDGIERLVLRAQAEGAMRADVGLADVRALLRGAGEVAEMAAGGAPELLARHLHLVLDGLRAKAATPMPAPPVGRARARVL
jgi:AcrR family transcriptional regulator